MINKEYSLALYNLKNQKIADLKSSNISFKGEIYDIKLTTNVNGWKELTFSVPISTDINSVEGTTNLIPQADLSLLHAYKLGVGTNGAFNPATKQSDGFWRVYKSDGTNIATEILIDKGYSISAGKIYTQSFLLRHDGTLNFTVSMFTNPSTGLGGHHAITPKIVDLGNGLKYVSATYITEAGATSLRVCDLTSLSGTFTYIDIKELQLEQKSYATPFVEGTRNSDTDTNFRASLIQNEYKVRLTRDTEIEEFIIKSVTKRRDTSGEKVMDISCQYMPIHRLSKSGFTFTLDMTGTAQQLLSEVLSKSDWNVGIVDNFYQDEAETILKNRTLKVERSNVYNMVQDICDLFQCYPVFNSSTKTIDLRKEIGVDNGVKFRYAKNLQNIEQVIATDEVVTKLWVEGGDAGDAGLTLITGVNPTGENYILNFDYYNQLGLLTSQQLTDIDNFKTAITNKNGEIKNALNNMSNYSTSLNNKEATLEIKIIERSTQQQLLDDILPEIAVETDDVKKAQLETTKNGYVTKISTLNGEIDTLTTEISNLKTQIDELNLEVLLSQKDAIIRDFEGKLGDFIFEGLFQDSNYVDDKALYEDALEVSANSAFPKISYTMSVFDLSKFTGFDVESFSYGDKVKILDDSLGIQVDGIIREIQETLDRPEETTVEIANFKTKFEDLFSKITTASETIKNRQEIYERAKGINSDGTLNYDILQKTFDSNKFIIQNGTNEDVQFGQTGIIIKDSINPSRVLKINSGGIFLTENYQETNPELVDWKVGMSGIGMSATNIITGLLDTKNLQIWNSNEPRFFWNSDGLYAYGAGGNGAIDKNKWIRFNKDGIYFTLDNGSTFESVWNWDGLKIGRRTAEEINQNLDDTIFSSTITKTIVDGMGGRNLTLNSGFIFDFRNWTNWNTPVVREVITSTNPKAKKELHLKMNYGNQGVMQDIKVIPNTTYMLSYDARIKGTDYSGIQLCVKGAGQPTLYTAKYGTFTDVNLLASDNLASIETDLTGFNSLSDRTTFSRTTEASYHGYASILVTPKITTTTGAGIYTDVTNITTNTDYTFSVYAKKKTGNADLYARIEWKDVNGTIVGSANSPIVALNTSNWLRLEVTSKAPLNAVKATICVYCKNGTSYTTTDAWYIDALQFEKGTQATTFVLPSAPQHFSFKYTIPEGYDIVQLQVGTGGNSSTAVDKELWISNIKFEVGDTDTIWTPAPEDAQLTADDAQTRVSNLITELASDNLLTPIEKQAVKKEWEGIVAEKAQFDPQITKYPTVDASAYNTAYSNLNTTLTPLLADMASTSDITAVTTLTPQQFRDRFTDYYKYKADLINKLDEATMGTGISIVDSIKTNPIFEDWTATLPDNYSLIGTVNPTKETTLKRTGNNSLRFNVTNSTVNVGVSSTAFINNVGCYTYIAVELGFMVVTGTTGGVKFNLIWNGLTAPNNVAIPFTGIDNFQTNKWYSIKKILKVPNTNVTGFTGYTIQLYANETSIGGATKDIVFDKILIREATQEEIKASQSLNQTDAKATIGGKIKVRYIRDSIGFTGNTVNTGKHWVEIQAYSNAVNVALGKTVTTNGTGTNLAYITNGNIATSEYASATIGSGDVYVQIDLGQVYDNLEYLVVHHYYGDSRSYKGNKTEVSEDGITWVKLFDSDITGLYVETANGHKIVVNTDTVITKNEVISAITQSAEAIKIQANRIDIVGAVTFESLNTDMQGKVNTYEGWRDTTDPTLISGNKLDTATQADIDKGVSAQGTLTANANTWTTTSTNFNNRNDRNSTVPANPVVVNTGTAIDHAPSNDGSVDISFEWTYTGTGNAYDIDGFRIFVYQSTVNSAYTFGTTPAEEQVFIVPADKRAFILYGVPTDKYYTFGVQAFRTVDTDIYNLGTIPTANKKAPSELISTIVKSTASGENPYQPSSSVEFNGNINGTIDGVPIEMKSPNVICARRYISGGVGQSTPSASILQSLGYTVTYNYTATVADCKNYDFVILDYYAWGADTDNQFIKDLFDDGQKVIVIGDDSGTGLFYITSSATASSFGIRTKANQSHPINDGWTTGQDFTANIGKYITGTVSGCIPITTYSSNGTLDTFLLTNNKGGMIVHCHSGFVNTPDMNRFTKNIVNYIIGNTLRTSLDGTAFFNGYSADKLITSMQNFNNRNDRKSTLPANPVVATDGTAVDHTTNTDGSCNLSFEWTYSGTGDAYDIDGFTVYVYQNTSSTAYAFGTSPADELVYNVTPDKRAFLLYGLPSDKYYTFAVQAYRMVDQDINNTGVLKSSIVKTTGTGENPYQPSTSVSFGGNITGTINGVSATTIQGGVQNFNNRNDRKNTTPANPVILTDGTAIDHTLNTDGSANISFEWGYTGSGDAYDIDGFYVYMYQNSANTGYTFGTKPLEEVVYTVDPTRKAFIIYGVPADKWYKFGVQAFRVVDQDINSSGLLKSAIVTPSLFAENPYQPSTSVAFSGDISGTTKINGVNASELTTLATNFNNRNDRLATVPIAPTVATDGTAVDYVANTDGSVDISFEWTYNNLFDKTKNTADVQVISEVINGMTKTVYVLDASTNATFEDFQTGLPTTIPPTTYPIADITKDYRITFKAKWTEFPSFDLKCYDATNVAIGNATISWTKQPAPDATKYQDYQMEITVFPAGTVNCEFFRWWYSDLNNTGLAYLTDIELEVVPFGKYDIDGFLVYVYQNTANTVYNFGTTPTAEAVYTVNADARALILYGCPCNKYYTFGVQAYRTVDTDIYSDGVLKSTITKATGTGENPFQPLANVAFAGNITGTINGTNATTVTTAVSNFNNRNDRITVTPANPTILADGTAIDHVLNKDGSADISFEWNFNGTGDAYNIDGFNIYVYQDTASTAYAFGTTPAKETVYQTTPDKRAFFLYGVPADKYYTFGIQAYRVVDKDIDSTGIKISGIVKPSLVGENPYQPSTSVAFSGDIAGTTKINGMDASDITDVALNFDARNDRLTSIPSVPSVVSDGNAVDHTINSDGSCDISFEWDFNTGNSTADQYNIDGFFVYVYQADYVQGTPATQYTFGTTPAKEVVYKVNPDKRSLILYGVPANKWYTFGVQSYRTVDKDVYDGVTDSTKKKSPSELVSAIVKPTLASENPYNPSTSIAFAGDISGTVKIDGIPASQLTDAIYNDNNVINDNPYFAKWSGSFPDGYATTVMGTGSSLTKLQEKGQKGYIAKFSITQAGQNAYLQAIKNTAYPFYQYIVLQATFRLDSGTTLDGSGILVRYEATANVDNLVKFTDFITTPVLGKWYTITKIIKLTTMPTGFTGYSVFPMGAYTELGTITTKEISFSEVVVRPATTEEANAYESKKSVDGWIHVDDPTKTKIDGGKIYTGSVTADAIQAGAITTDKLAVRGELCNVALNRTVTVSGGSNAFGGMTSATTATTGARWQTPTSVTPCTATVDLGASVLDIISVEFGTWANTAGELKNYIPSGYKIDYSIDNISWTNLATVTTNSGASIQLYPVHIHPTGFQARYIRLTVTGLQSGYTYCNIANFRVMSRQNGTLIDGATIKTSSVTATQIDASNLHVSSANIDGRLTAGQIDATSLHVSSANIDGKLTASQIETGALTSNTLTTTNTGGGYMNIQGNTFSTYSSYGGTALWVDPQGIHFNGSSAIWGDSSGIQIIGSGLYSGIVDCTTLYADYVYVNSNYATSGVRYIDAFTTYVSVSGGNYSGLIYFNQSFSGVESIHATVKNYPYYSCSFSSVGSSYATLNVNHIYATNHTFTAEVAITILGY